ncbi:MAG: ABC transporter ATP-binding protein [Dehalococcoidia bacterium]|nr:ABC transporter ATP-binding protein [Dehalococcoidia bacterium]MDW8120304.1 ABC transporter ATP-binding protein [Chloroflexota bacterium]
MEGDGKPFIVCQDLFKIYKRADLEVVALRGVDLVVHQGEFLAIIGASGSGKSTLLNILAGLDRPSAGKVWVGQRDLLAMTEADRIAYRRKEVGFLWQSAGRNLLPYLTAQEQVELPMALAGVGIFSRRKRARELLERVGLGDKTRRLPHQLSGGEQQRVAIAVAMANQPPLLLADEPTGELDTRTAEEVFRALREVNTTYGTTIVLVTHYPGAGRWADRVVRIRDGRIASERVHLPSFRAGEEGREEEFLVVDQVGRMQLPLEVVQSLGLKGRTRLTVQEGRAIIAPAQEGSHAP